MTKEAGPATPVAWLIYDGAQVVDFFAQLVPPDMGQFPSTYTAQPLVPQSLLLAAEERAATDHKNLIDMLALEVELRRQAERRAAELEAKLAACDLWVWRNGEKEWWIFDNEYPCYENGDPMTLGEPWGRGVFKPSIPREAFRPKDNK